MLKFALFLLIFFLYTKPASADIKVNISDNLEGSSNSVKINSDTSSSKQSSSGSVNNRTDIVINNNGEIKEYHGEGGNIELKSGDGKSSVSVNTTGTGNNTTESTSNITSKTNISVQSNTSDASPSSTPEATVAGIFKDNTEEKVEKAGLLEFIKRQFEGFFKLFS